MQCQMVVHTKKDSILTNIHFSRDMLDTLGCNEIRKEEALEDENIEYKGSTCQGV